MNSLTDLFQLLEIHQSDVLSNFSSAFYLPMLDLILDYFAKTDFSSSPFTGVTPVARVLPRVSSVCVSCVSKICLLVEHKKSTRKTDTHTSDFQHGWNNCRLISQRKWRRRRLAVTGNWKQKADVAFCKNVFQVTKLGCASRNTHTHEFKTDPSDWTNRTNLFLFRWKPRNWKRLGKVTSLCNFKTAT